MAHCFHIMPVNDMNENLIQMVKIPWPFFDLVFVPCFRIITFEGICVDFFQTLQNFISLKIQVKFDIGNHPPNFD